MRTFSYTYDSENSLLFCGLKKFTSKNEDFDVSWTSANQYIEIAKKYYGSKVSEDEIAAKKAKSSRSGSLFLLQWEISIVLLSNQALEEFCHAHKD